METLEGRLLLAVDFGDAPDPTFPTLLANNGARHEIEAGFHLGNTIDAEPDGQPDKYALGDDLDGNIDDDGVSFVGWPEYPGTSGGITITLTDNSLVGGFLDAWVDFNNNGAWEAGEQVATSFPLNDGANPLPVTIPGGIGPGYVMSRFRLSRDGGLASFGPAPDGEVEDYAVLIKTEPMDFGDAPLPYPTYSGYVGPLHTIVPGFYLGTSVDSDFDGQPNTDASGDDIGLFYPGTPFPPGDEDGVVFTSPLVPGMTTTLTVTDSASIGAGLLDAWVDFNNDGSWTAGEKVFASTPLSGGINLLSFPVPSDATLGERTFARFRLSSAGGLDPIGYAPDGEVEDYALGSIHGQKFEDLNGNGERDPGEPGLNGFVIELYDAAGITLLTSVVTMDMELDGTPGIDPQTETGVYWLPGLPPGKYVIREEVPSGFEQTYPAVLGSNEYSVTLGDGQVLGTTPAEVNVICGPGPHWVDDCGTPAIESFFDVFFSVATVQLQGDMTSPLGEFTDTVFASGETQVSRGEPTESVVSSGHFDRIDTEIVSMDLTGSFPLLGQIRVRAGTGAGLAQPTLGLVQEQAGNPFLADSFFDVYFEVDTPLGTLHNNLPLPVSAVIEAVPPYEADFVGQIPVQLLNAANEPTGITITQLTHTPAVGVDFGNTVPGSIHGFKYEDVDADGVYNDAIDLPLAGVDFTLTGTDGQGNIVNTIETTDVNGEFWYTGLLASVDGVGPATGYTVTETVPAGFVPTTPTSYATDLISRQELVAFDGQAMIPPPTYSQLPKLLASDGAASDFFGEFVAIDDNVAVVGAQGENGSQGAAYVYEYVAGFWSEVAKLTASDGAANDFFGTGVSISGDTVIVGAYGDDDGGSSSGSAYVFVRPGTAWADANEDAKLTASDAAADAMFGRGAVSISGDTIVVGARGSTGFTGAAYVYVRPGGGWTGALNETAKMTASDAASGDEFGYAASISGETVVVGARRDDDTATNSGSAYVYVKPLAGWANTSSENAKLTASDAASSDEFGESVSNSGDTIVIGAYSNNDAGANSGSAYVYVKPLAGWSNMNSENAKLTASDAALGDYFGGSVSISGDRIVIGADGDDDGGAAYLFARPGSGWAGALTEDAKLSASDETTNDYFGGAVGISNNTVVVGAVGDDDNGTDSGSAYVFTAVADPRVEVLVGAPLMFGNSDAETDYGDAPDPTYATLLASNGPRHLIFAGAPTLGALIDSESDGQPDATATGDDNDGTDDEDGVVSVSNLFTSLPASFDVDAPLGGKLDAWLDVNGNGVFDHPAEHVGAGTSVTLTPGLNTVNFTIPPDAVPGLTMARLRISTAGGLLPTGLAFDGEVEDYDVLIERVFVVNSIGDLGDNNLSDNICDTGGLVGLDAECTLRAAIQQANASANAATGPDKIFFNIPGAGVHTTVPGSVLPTITEAVIIDGTTQPGFAGTPLFEIDGSGAGAGVSGLTIASGDSTVRQLAVNRFASHGIVLATGGGNTIEQNTIGTDPAGTTDLGNGAHGVVIFNSPNNVLQANVISGNNVHGVYITKAGSTTNQVQSNSIGLGANGVTPLGNGGDGVRIDQGASGNTIGSPINLISANGGTGVIIVGAGTTGNTVAGNNIGVDISGMLDRGNAANGVTIDGAPGNQIGVPGDGNLISGNTGNGVFITGVTAANNLVQGNKIGLNNAGTTALQNNSNGVNVNGAPNNTIGGTAAGAGNVISGNNKSGVFIVGNAASGNKVEGNFVGTNSTGNSAVPNVQFGVVLRDAPNNTVGGTAPGARNVISGNSKDGVAVLNPLATGNVVAGNLIGTDITGTADVGNGTSGVLIWKAPGNTVGGTTPAARNIISGNDLYGVRITTFQATGNVVQGNYIGTDTTGTVALPNSESGVQLANSQINTIGGSAPGAGNLISGNSKDGVVLSGAGVFGNVIQGNIIGLDVTGTAALGNSAAGVRIAGGANENTVGGDSTAGEGNVISANGAEGVIITNAGTHRNTVSGNLIGLDATGTVALGNTTNGVTIFQADTNTIGGMATGAGNVISGNGLFGVAISGASATANKVEGNAIGTDISGTLDRGNSSSGVFISAPGNTIGGSAPGAGNLISGNDFTGVRISGSSVSGNVVQGNLIGTQIDGTSPLGNTGDGVFIDGGASDNTIGGTVSSAGNVIADNTARGVWITGTSSTGNTISRNSIHDNGALGIDLSPAGLSPNDPGDPDIGPNNLQNFPVIDSVVKSGTNLEVTLGVDSTVANSAYPLTLEVFIADSASQEGETFLGSASYPAGVAGTSVTFVFAAGAAIVGSPIVATATDDDGNTSEFSAPVTVASMLLAASEPILSAEACRAYRGDSPVKSAELQTLQAGLPPIVDAGILRWQQTGLDANQISRLNSLDIRFAELDGLALGMTTGNTILLDTNAAGYGWFIDPTPLDDSEFSSGSRPLPLDSRPSSLDSQLRMDLLTAVMHEMGHVAGLEDLADPQAADDLLYESLALGVRKAFPSAAVVDAAFSDL